MYNLMSGAGFEGGAFASAWIMIWVGLFVMAVLIMLSKRWFEEEGLLGEYSFVGGFIGPIVYIIIAMFVGEARWALIGGLIGMYAGGKMMARVQT